MKRLLLILLPLLLMMGCEDKIITTNPKLDYKKEILGNWAIDENLYITFFDNGHIKAGEKSIDGIFTYTETLYYTITENEIQINCPKDMKDAASMNFSYSPSEDFSSLNITHLIVEYYDGRETVEVLGENKFFTKRDDLVFQKPFYEK